MTAHKHVLALAFAALAALPLKAQTNGSNSSYSRFGMGNLNTPYQGFNRSMGGVAQGMADGRIVNMQNPASYSRIDSLTFIFDVGMGLSFGHYTQGNNSVNARNTSLDYVNAGFRLAKGLGMSFGFVPYSTIGYTFSSESLVGTNYNTGKEITATTTYSGDGGLHQLYIGFGWNPFAHLSIGANISYLWGEYSHSLAQTYAEGGTTSSSYNSQNMVWSSDVRTYKLDIGAQYPIIINPQNMLTLGATVSLGHEIDSKVDMMRYTSLNDTVQDTRSDAFEIPLTWSVGVAWQHAGKLTIAADYQQQKWDGCRIPISTTVDGTPEIEVRTDQYKTRHQINVGAEWRMSPFDYDTYSKRIRYRIGAQYATPYTRVNGYDGPTEYGVTAGVALPLSKTSRTVVNVGLQWFHREPSTSTQVTENYVMLNLGVTFNERWFSKWKFN